MNIYTLHKAGSFRPPTLETVAEIENIPREKLPRRNFGVDENKVNGSTIQTSETRGSEHSSSCGEKTTPRHNVTATYANNLSNNVTQNARQNVQQPARLSASRIDASGIITDTAADAVPSKASIDKQRLARRRKVKATAYPSRKNPAASPKWSDGNSSGRSGRTLSVPPWPGITIAKNHRQQRLSIISF